MTERLWIIAAGLLLVVAAFFLWRNNLSAAFVTGTLGAVAWFLSYRLQLRRKMVSEVEVESNENNDEI